MRLHWGYIRVMLGLPWGYIRVIVGLHWGSIEVIMENETETAIFQ